LPFSLIETLVCMPLPFTPTTGLGRKDAVNPMGRDRAADQFVELDLSSRPPLAVAVVDFKLRRRDFGMASFSFWKPIERCTPPSYR
jgi:hypothetical protein